MPEYRCLECEETFEHQANCAAHHLETKHNDFEIPGTDVKICIRS